MSLLDILQNDPRTYVVIVVCGMLSVVLHELGHGFAALRQGDDTPRLLGHITWNPVVHMGWTGLAFLALFGIGFGSTPVNPSRFRSKWGDAIVSFAGPAVNVVLFLIAGTLLGLVKDPPDYTELFFEHLALLNVLLLLFNMLPVPPLDGSAVLANFSPEYAQAVRNPAYSGIFLLLLLALFFFGGKFLWPLAEDVVDAYVGWIRRLGA